MKQLHYMEGSPKIAYDRAGRGPLVVFLHGVGGNRLNWEVQVEHFGARYCAIAWDARGYGASDDSPSTLKFGDYGDDLRRLLDHLKAEKAHLVGLSMGGMILQDFYGRYADRVATLALVDTNSGMAMQSEEFKREFLARRLAPLEAGKTPADTAEENARALCSPRTPIELITKLKASLAMLRVEPYKQALRAIITTDFRAVQPRVAVPILVVVGEDDKLTPLAAADEIVARVPGARREVIKGAGHLSNIEQAEAFNAVIGEFLDRHAALATRVG